MASSCSPLKTCGRVGTTTIVWQVPLSLGFLAGNAPRIGKKIAQSARESHVDSLTQPRRRQYPAAAVSCAGLPPARVPDQIRARYGSKAARLSRLVISPLPNILHAGTAA
jgi:hypothetical protein